MQVLMKVLALIAVMPMVFLTNTPAASAAQNIEVDGFSYTMQNDNTLTLIGCTSSCGAKDLVIPATVQELPVTRISDDALRNKNFTGSLTLPSSLVQVGSWALAQNKLTIINLPDTPITFGEGALSLNSISSFKAPSWLTNIPDYFMIDNPIKTLVLGEAVSTIGESAFKGNKLAKLILPASVLALGGDAFTSLRSSPLNVYFKGLPPTVPTGRLPFSNVYAGLAAIKGLVNVYAPSDLAQWGKTFGLTKTYYSITKYKTALFESAVPKPSITAIARATVVSDKVENWLLLKLPLNEATTLLLKTTPKDVIGDPSTTCSMNPSLQIPGFAKSSKFVYCEVPDSSKWTVLKVTPYRYGIAGVPLEQTLTVSSRKKLTSYVCRYPARSSKGPVCSR